MNTPGEQQQSNVTASKSSSSSTSTINSIVSAAAVSQASRRTSSDAGGGGYPQTDTVVQRSTPILFSTNRGLHLRVYKPLAASTTSTATTAADAYDIRLCDLERWSTNRANTVSLEDTITSSRTFTVAIPPSQRGSFIPVKQHFNTFR